MDKPRAADRIGTTVGNFKILDYKWDYEKKETFYFIKCELCHNEKWTQWSVVKKAVGCGCQDERKIAIAIKKIGTISNNSKILDYNWDENNKIMTYFVKCIY